MAFMATLNEPHVTRDIYEQVRAEIGWDHDPPAGCLLHIAAFDEAKAQGKGVAVVDGRIVENLHVETARATLAMAEAIASRGA